VETAVSTTFTGCRIPETAVSATFQGCKVPETVVSATFQGCKVPETKYYENESVCAPKKSDKNLSANE
jgi:hypothetical protein